MDILQTKKMLIYVAEKIMENQEYLCRVDAQIGDGDHGIGMYNGMKKVKETLESKEFLSINHLFTTMGMTMTMTMGGASGILFGTLFMQAFSQEEQFVQLTTQKFVKGMENGLKGIQQRVESKLGDKTMLDALVPAVECMQQNSQLQLLEVLLLAETAAKNGVEATKQYVAKYGRAKFLGERAIGFQDAGATSIWLIFSFMREWVERNG